MIIAFMNLKKLLQKQWCSITACISLSATTNLIYLRFLCIFISCNFIILLLYMSKANVGPYAFTELYLINLFFV